MSFRFLSVSSGLFHFMRLQRYNHISRYVLSTGIVHNPFSCGGEEEIALSVCIDISFDIVIVFIEEIAYFAPIVVMIGAIFVCDRVIVSGCQPQLYNMDVLINRKLNQHFLICAVYNPKSGIG